MQIPSSQKLWFVDVTMPSGHVKQIKVKASAPTIALQKALKRVPTGTEAQLSKPDEVDV